MKKKQQEKKQNSKKKKEKSTQKHSSPKKNTFLMHHFTQFKQKRPKLTNFIITLIVLVIIISTILFIFSSQIHFFLNGQLTIDITPKQALYTTEHGTQIELQNDISVNSYAQCTFVCNLSITDEKTNTPLFYQTFTEKESYTHTYNLSYQTPNKGEGKQTIGTTVSCSVQQSFLCSASNTTVSKKALTIVAYTFTEAEQAVINNREIIQKQLTAIETTTQFSTDAQTYATLLYPQLTTNNNTLQETTETLSTYKDKILTAWNAQDYETIQLVFSDDTTATIDTLQNDTQFFLQHIEQKKNNYLTYASFVTSYQDAIATMSDFLDHITQYEVGNYSAVAQAFTTIRDNTKTKEQLFTTNTTYNDTLLQTALLQIKDEYALYQKIKEQFENITQELEQNASSLFNMTASTTLSCQDIEEQDTAITILINTTQDEIIHLTQSYTNQTNQTVYDEQIENKTTELQQLQALKQSIKNATTLFCIKEKKQEIILPYIAQLENLPAIQAPTLQDTTIYLTAPQQQCCTKNSCTVCNTQTNTPVLFLHGHAFNKGSSPLQSLQNFASMQQALERDNNNYTNAGEFDVSQATLLPYGSYSGFNTTLTFRGTYYVISYVDVGDYTISVQKSERIENYAVRLKEVIDALLETTGSQNITIVAHSMGGLVVREYMSLFGEDAINKVITINTPHQGVTGTVESLCDVLGATKECEDMSQGSIFLQRLSRYNVSSVDFYAIRSTGCEMSDGAVGDGIVTIENGYLEGAQNYLINGTCTDALQTNLHGAVLDIEKYPQVYALVKELLEE